VRSASSGPILLLNEGTLAARLYYSGAKPEIFCGRGAMPLRDQLHGAHWAYGLASIASENLCAGYRPVCALSDRSGAKQMTREFRL
jgi:hypothetical protein